MSPSEMATRAAEIRLTDKALGAAANLSENTVNRTLSGRTRPLLDTAQALAAVIEREELRLLRYLISLHGVPASTSTPEQQVASS